MTTTHVLYRIVYTDLNGHRHNGAVYRDRDVVERHAAGLRNMGYHDAHVQSGTIVWDDDTPHVPSLADVQHMLAPLDMTADELIDEQRTPNI